MAGLKRCSRSLLSWRKAYRDTIQTNTYHQ